MNLPSIFLAESISNNDKRKEVRTILERAGFMVVSSEHETNDLNTTRWFETMNSTNCSLHILDISGESEPADEKNQLALKQFHHALSISHEKPDYKIIVWQEGKLNMNAINGKQAALVNEIRNNISGNMIFTDVNSAIHLVDDIRSFIEEKKTVNFDVREAEVFFISNQLDENEANEIIDMLTDVVSVEKLYIIQDSPVDYSEFCRQQIEMSKIAVIYFKHSTDWALPFTQEIWKRMGGASSNIPILLIGDEFPESNKSVKFAVPKVSYVLVSGALIPLEIKVRYDKAIGNN